MTKPTILHISHISNDLAMGPVHSIPRLVRALDDLGMPVALYTTNPLAPFSQEQNYPVFYYRDYGNILDITRLPAPFDNPDLVVFNDVYVIPHILLAYRLRQRGTPYIMTPRGGLTVGAQNMKRRKKRIANFLFFNAMVKGAIAIHCLSENEAQDTRKWGRPVFVAGNGVDLPTIDGGDHAGDRDSLQLVFIGRLDIHHKGLDLLLEASRLAQDVLREVNATINLYGPEVAGSRAKMTAYIFQHQLSDVVILHGPTYGAEKDWVLRHADLFLHPSRFEGHPMAVLEALAYGVPCLLTPGTNIGDEVSLAGAGWCTAPHSEAIAACFREILRNRHQLSAARCHARQLATEQYSWRHVGERVVEEYLKLHPLAAFNCGKLQHDS